MKKVSVIFGTRPEAIKLCPLIRALRKQPDYETHVCVTGQHREMLNQVLEVFEIVPDVNLALMEHNQSLATLTSRAITALDSYIKDHVPDIVFVQGDTSTVFAAALAAYYHKAAVGHVEAGLRTWNKYSPFPEEVNRILATHLADYHFAPTEWAKNNLLREGIKPERIFVTGNTVIDALHIAVEKVRNNPVEIPNLPLGINKDSDQPIVLITGHRRENFGQGFLNICKALGILANKFQGTAFVYPVHLNPNVHIPVYQHLHGKKNIYLIEPLSYLPFVAMMDRAKIILTDSGGVQEEAPSLGKPVLVMRDTTERPEAVEAGTVKLVGTSIDKIVDNVTILLNDQHAYAAMARATNPYGEGHACEKIIKALQENGK